MVSLESLKEDLTCAICYEIQLEPTVIICKNGHDICWNCKLKVQNCPTCKGHYSTPLTRNRSKEEIIKKYDFTFVCQNRVQGCMEELPRSQLQEHAKGCQFRLVACPWRDCDKKVRFQELLTHMSQKNRALNVEMGEMVEGDYFNRFHFNPPSAFPKPFGWDVSVLTRFGETFLMCFECVGEIYYFWIYIMGGEAKARRFSAQVAFLGYDDSEQEEMYTCYNNSVRMIDRVYSIDVPKKEVLKDCAAVMERYRRKMMQNGEALYTTLKIFLNN